MRNRAIMLAASQVLSGILFLGCQATTVKAPQDFSQRRPSSDVNPSYPLNPRFEVALANENELINQIQQGILSIQSNDAKAAGNQLHRGTHAKGVCAMAEMEIFDLAAWSPDISSRLKVGIFSSAGRYPAQLRFANAEGKIQSDQVDDVRAVSISMKMPPEISNPQGTMDFSMNDAAFFPIGTAQSFADLMSFAKDQSLAGLYGKVGPTRANAVMWALGLGKLQETQSGHKTAYQKLRYWSDVAFALGDREAVKYSLKPCSTNQANPLLTSTDNPVTSYDALAIELRRHLQNDNPPSCFEFQVQLLEPAKMSNHLGQAKSATYWVENADVEWSESQAPFYTVGRLTLAHGPAVPADQCENWQIDVTTNNNITHHGLGSINRARGAAESASAARRKAPHN